MPLIHNKNDKVNYAPISIVIANYNNARYLDDCIDSIMQSTILPQSIIVVDDGSTDNSVSVLERISLEISMLELVKFEKNKGFAEALNKALDCVETEFVMRLDPDDCILPNRIECQVKFLIENRNVGVVGSNVSYFKDDGSKIAGESNFKSDHEWIKQKYLEGEHGVMHGATASRSNLYDLYRYRQEYVPAEDYDIFSRMVKGGIIFANIPDRLSLIRIHVSSVSNTLKFDTVQKTFLLREENFGIKYSSLLTSIAFTSRKHYRLALFSSTVTAKVYHLLISGILNPRAVLRRFINHNN